MWGARILLRASAGFRLAARGNRTLCAMLLIARHEIRASARPRPNNVFRRAGLKNRKGGLHGLGERRGAGKFPFHRKPAAPQGVAVRYCKCPFSRRDASTNNENSNVVLADPSLCPRLSLPGRAPRPAGSVTQTARIARQPVRTPIRVPIFTGFHHVMPRARNLEYRAIFLAIRSPGTLPNATFFWRALRLT